MNSLLTPEFWEYFNQTQEAAFETFGKETLVFKKLMYNMDDFEEDPESTGDSLYTSYTFSCIINYNYYRVWGVNSDKAVGEKQGQSMAVILSRKVLAEATPSIIDANGNLLYDSGTDFFLHRGIRYTSQGDTFLSQDDNNPLYLMLILQRDKRYTGEDKGEQT